MCIVYYPTVSSSWSNIHPSIGKNTYIHTYIVYALCRFRTGQQEKLSCSKGNWLGSEKKTRWGTTVRYRRRSSAANGCSSSTLVGDGDAVIFVVVVVILGIDVVVLGEEMELRDNNCCGLPRAGPSSSPSSLCTRNELPPPSTGGNGLVAKR